MLNKFLFLIIIFSLSACGGGSGGDDNNSSLEPECIENSKSDNLYHYQQESMHQSDSEMIDTETESDWSEDSDWDEKNFLKSLFDLQLK